jgi:hypothetical protein
VVIPLVAVSALALPTTAAACWQYRGHLHDAKRTTIQLAVVHPHAHPRRVVDISTGRIGLDCRSGAVARHLLPGLAEPVGFDVLRSGRFAFSIESGIVGIGGVHTSSVTHIRGTVKRHSASGFLRLQWTNHGRRGKCDSGRLRWYAHFVPRAH